MRKKYISLQMINKSMIKKIIFLFACLLFSTNLIAQEEYKDEFDVGEPLTPEYRIKKGEYWDRKYQTVMTLIELPTVYCFPELKFKNRRQQLKYTKLVRNVKKTLPIAKLINGTIIETYEYLQTLNTQKEKEAHLVNVEKGLKKQYTPQMKKLTFTQGKLLIKLVDRECNQRAYDIIKAFMGSFKAGVYNAFASIFGASLKKVYDPEENDDDKLTERVVILVENGLI